MIDRNPSPSTSLLRSVPWRSSRAGFAVWFQISGNSGNRAHGGVADTLQAADPWCGKKSLDSCRMGPQFVNAKLVNITILTSWGMIRKELDLDGVLNQQMDPYGCMFSKDYVEAC